MLKGTMEFRIGNEKRKMKPGDLAVIPGGVEHEGYFLEASEVIDFFAPVREDFLSGAPARESSTSSRRIARKGKAPKPAFWVGLLPSPPGEHTADAPHRSLVIFYAEIVQLGCAGSRSSANRLPGML